MAHIVGRIDNSLVGRKLLAHNVGKKKSILYIEVEVRQASDLFCNPKSKILRIDTIGDNELKIVKEGTLTECDLYYKNLILTESKLN